MSISYSDVNIAMYMLVPALKGGLAVGSAVVYCSY